jgi:hypothetical protein
VALSVLAATLGCQRSEAPPAPSAPAAAPELTFAGAAKCAGCHPKEAEAHRGADHALAMQPANQQTVLGDNFNTGSKDATVYILNVQPVIPIHLTHDWNLIRRTIMPIMNQPSLFPGPNSISGRAWGLGDATIIAQGLFANSSTIRSRCRRGSRSTTSTISRRS